MAVVMVTFDSGFLDRPVHSLDLAVCPGMLDFGEPVLDPVLTATHVKHMRHVSGRGSVGVARRERELNAVVGQDGMDFIGHGRDQRDQEGGCWRPACFGDQLDEDELAGPVYRDVKIELAFGRAHFGDVDMEVPNRTGLELLLRFLVPVTSGNRLISCRCKQRCRDERVKCGIVACRA